MTELAMRYYTKQSYNESRIRMIIALSLDIFDIVIRYVCAVRLTVIRIQRCAVSRNDACLAYRFGAHLYTIHIRIS